MAPTLAEVRAGTPVRRFREFRWSRPFWAAVLVAIAGAELAILPIGPTDALIRAGASAFLGLVCAVVLLLMAAVLLFLPSQRVLAGLVAVVVSVGSFPLSNLGGFVVGMLLGVLGGSMAVGWVPDKALFGRAGDAAELGSPSDAEVAGEGA